MSRTRRHRTPPTSASTRTAAADESTTWGILLANVFGRVVLGVLAGLLLWTVIPGFLGWNTTMVMSDSMAPALRTGDALIAQPTTASRVKPGQVLVVDDPDHPGRLRAHRLEEIRDDGTLILRGDANQQADTTPVPLQDLHGLGRLRIPYVALPGVWLKTGHPLYALGSVLFLGLMVAAATAGPARTRAVTAAAYRAARHRATRRRLPRQLALGAPLTTMAFALSVTLVVVVTGSVAPAYAKFSASTSNPSSSWTAADSFCPAPGSFVVNPDADDWVDELAPDATTGGASDLEVAAGYVGAKPAARRTFIRFPLTQVPARCTVTSATLTLHLAAATAGRTLVVRRTGPWTEGQITWNTMPGIGGATTTVSSAMVRSLDIPVDAQVAGMAAGNNHGLVIMDSAETDAGQFAQTFFSREQPKGVPTLTVNYG